MRLEKTVLYESDKAAPEFSRQLNERKRHSASKNDIEYNIDESTHGSASNWERSRLLTTLGEFWKRAVALLANEVLTYTNRNMNKFNRSCHNNEWPVEHGCFRTSLIVCGLAFLCSGLIFSLPVPVKKPAKLATLEEDQERFEHSLHQLQYRRER
jgi:hypothetical protein